MADEQSEQQGLDLLDFDVLGYELVTIKKTVPLLDAETDEPVLDPATGQFVTERRTWDLHDDVPMEVMVRLFLLLRREDRALRAFAQADPDAGAGADAASEAEREAERAADAEDARMLEFLSRKDAVVTRVCLDLFRHTYPTTRERQLRGWFTASDREVIVNRFFGHRGMLSSPAQPPTPSSTTTPPPPTTTPTTPTTPTTQPVPPLAPAPAQPSRPATTRSSGASQRPRTPTASGTVASGTAKRGTTARKRPAAG